MHDVRHLPVFPRLLGGTQLAGERLDPAGSVRRIAARYDQADVTARTLGKVGCQAIVLVAVFEPRMHRAHEHAVLQRGEAEVERSKEVRVVGAGHGP